jgi:uncharacterized protein (TIGR03083 family)
MMKNKYLDHFHSNRAAILSAAAVDLDAPIKGCPGWDVAALTGHMGRVYTFWLKWVCERPRGASKEAFAELMAEREARLPGYIAWRDPEFHKEARPAGIVEFARDTGNELEDALRELSPDEQVWTFVPSQQTGAFLFRRLALETAVHRWDAEEAVGAEQPIEEALARDGIDETLMMFANDPAYEEHQPLRRGQRILLRDDGGEGQWLVMFGEEGITTSPGDGPADATITGSASDLLLFIMGRRTPEEMQIEGDKALAATWGDLAGRF